MNYEKLAIIENKNGEKWVGGVATSGKLSISGE